MGHTTGDMRVDMREVVERKNRNVNDWRTLGNKISERANTSSVSRPCPLHRTAQTERQREELESDRIFINTGTRPVAPIFRAGANAIPY